MSDDAWQSLQDANDQYLSAGEAALADDAAGTLRAVFASGRGHYAALRLLGDRASDSPELAQELMPELFSAALGINPYAARARFILAGLPPHLRDSRLEALARQEIANPDPDPDRWADLRGLAMLLEHVGRLDLLEVLKDAVRDSPDEDLRDIAEDFPEFS
ncbi:hypothetical protein JOF56_004113 [Kibdelosporangium banguiense]|uniref:Uncharacterized protein n=1 Tax=Kibdelosporangium banguiense TaxID=1365924 RepID=A0ABS4TH12_9PSEU|nr:hypothetical protein [Kibdelosporangium banguiense]MBP2323728.1 hypothetical protein [Kibdelosporangium banguiense]